MNTTILYIVRHGESFGNIDPLTSGPDPELTPTGKKQAKAKAKEFAEIPFSAVYSSHSIRAVQTAKIIKGKRPISHQIIPELRERWFGNFFSHPEYENISQDFKKTISTLTLEEWWHYKHPKVDGMETDHEALSRLLHHIQTIAKTHKKETVLLISHGNLMRDLLIHLSYDSYTHLRHNSVQNCGHIVLSVKNKQLSITSVSGVKTFDDI